MTSRVIPRLLEYLHEADHYGRELGEFVEVLADICFRNMPYAVGQVLLGRTCPKRWLYDFPSAMVAYGIGRHHLNAFVVGTPELAVHRTDRRQDSLIPADVADRLFLGRTPFVTAGEMSKALGRHPRDAAAEFANLVGAGIIEQETGASTADLPPIFSKPAFDAALGDFIARFEPADPLDPGMAGIGAVSAAYHLTLADLWKLLASGSITRMGLIPDQGTIAGMRFDMREILAAITGIGEPLTVNEVADRLGVNSSKVRNLVYKQKLMPSPVRTDIKTGLVHVFAKATVEAFETEFLSSKHTRSMIDGMPSLTQLKKQGLLPAFELEGQDASYGRTIFYRRAEVLEFVDRNRAIVPMA